MAIVENYISTHSGTFQTDRFPLALASDYIRIDERDFSDLIKQVANFAHQVNFYDDEGHKAGTWIEFFQEFYDGEQVNVKELELQMNRGNIKPHFALMLAFLKLFAIEQKNLNSLTEKHMEFYYKQILNFLPRKGTYGTVPVFFTLRKNVQSVFLPKGTLFDAGKDANSRPIMYKSMDDVTLTHTAISKIWWSNGSTIKRLGENGSIGGEENYSIYISSAAFLLKDGVRIISFGNEYIGKFGIEYTTETGWSEEIFPQGNKVTIDETKPAFVAYNSKTHGTACTGCSVPVLKITSACIDTLEAFIKKKVVISIEVKGSKDIIIKNAMGILQNEVGVMPFGTKCHKGDKLQLIPPLSAGSIKNVHIKLDNSVYILSGDKKRLTLNSKDYDQDAYTREMVNFVLKKSEIQPKRRDIIRLDEPISVDYNCKDIAFRTYVTSSISKELTETSLSSFQDSSESQALIIELEGNNLPCILSIYFLLNAFKKSDAHVVQWSFFCDNCWQKFSPYHLLKDTTEGLRQTGIVNLNISKPNIKWIRAVLSSSYEPTVIESICTQVAELSFDTNSESSAQVGVALKANTISKLVTQVAGIKKVYQPYVGKQGIYDETREQYICRVSEKLRHKGRAWTPWDYERLVLERFPQISVVRCFPAFNGQHKECPGNVLLVVVPKKNDAALPLNNKPEVEAALLLDIKKYIEACSSTQVNVHVEAPLYEEIKVSCTLCLRQGYSDKNHYSSLLNQQLIHYLAPWVSSTEQISFGRKLHESKLLMFITELPYVDHVVALKVYHDGALVNNGETIMPKAITSILTTADNHTINIV